jgi:hypothetical protein
MTFKQFIDAVDAGIGEWALVPLAVQLVRTDQGAEWRRDARWCRVQRSGDGAESVFGLDGPLAGDRHRYGGRSMPSPPRYSLRKLEPTFHLRNEPVDRALERPPPLGRVKFVLVDAGLGRVV